MLIRKITEYGEKCNAEKILLICDDKDEGWEMTGDELRTLRDLIDKVYSPAVSPPHEFPYTPDDEARIAKFNEEVNRLTRLDEARVQTIVMQKDQIRMLETEVKEQIKYIDEASKTYTLLTEDKHFLESKIAALEAEVKERGALLDRNNERHANLIKDCQILDDQINKLALYIMKNVKGEPSRSEGAVDTAIRLLNEYQKDNAAECPDFIEPPESQENLVITEVPIIAEKYTETPEIVPEIEEKVPKTAEKDFSSYVQMFKDRVSPQEIQKKMTHELGIAQGTASTYYYTKVKPEAAKQIEAEKKAVEKELEPKIQRKDDTMNKDKALMQEIAALSEFKTPDDFLTYALVYEIGTDRKAKELKEMYLKTHPGTNW